MGDIETVGLAVGIWDSSALLILKPLKTSEQPEREEEIDPQQPCDLFYYFHFTDKQTED